MKKPAQLQQQVLLSAANNHQSTHTSATEASAARLILVLRALYPNIKTSMLLDSSCTTVEKDSQKAEQVALMNYIWRKKVELMAGICQLNASSISDTSSIKSTALVVDYICNSTNYIEKDKRLILDRLTTFANTFPGSRWDENIEKWCSNRAFHPIQKQLVVEASLAETLNLVTCALQDNLRFISSNDQSDENYKDRLNLFCGMLLNQQVQVEKKKHDICSGGMQHEMLFHLNYTFLVDDKVDETSKPIEFITDNNSFILKEMKQFVHYVIDNIANKDQQKKLLHDTTLYEISSDETPSNQTSKSPIRLYLEQRQGGFELWKNECVERVIASGHQHWLDISRDDISTILGQLDYIEFSDLLITKKLLSCELSSTERYIEIFHPLIHSRNKALQSLQIVLKEQHSFDLNEQQDFHYVEYVYDLLINNLAVNYFGSCEVNAEIISCCDRVIQFYENTSDRQNACKMVHAEFDNIVDFVKQQKGKIQYDFITNFFQMYQNKKALPSELLSFNKDIKISNDELTTWYRNNIRREEDNQSLNLTSYQINRILLYALITQPSHWTEGLLFSIQLILKWVSTVSEQDSFSEKALKNSYPKAFLISIHFISIIAEKALDKIEKSTIEFISPDEIQSLLSGGLYFPIFRSIFVENIPVLISDALKTSIANHDIDIQIEILVTSLKQGVEDFINNIFIRALLPLLACEKKQCIGFNFLITHIFTLPVPVKFTKPYRRIVNDFANYVIQEKINIPNFISKLGYRGGNRGLCFLFEKAQDYYNQIIIAEFISQLFDRIPIECWLNPSNAIPQTTPIQRLLDLRYKHPTNTLFINLENRLIEAIQNDKTLTIDEHRFDFRYFIEIAKHGQFNSDEADKKLFLFKFFKELLHAQLSIDYFSDKKTVFEWIASTYSGRKMLRRMMTMQLSVDGCYQYHFGQVMISPDLLDKKVNSISIKSYLTDSHVSDNDMNEHDQHDYRFNLVIRKVSDPQAFLNALMQDIINGNNTRVAQKLSQLKKTAPPIFHELLKNQLTNQVMSYSGWTIQPGTTTIFQAALKCGNTSVVHHLPGAAEIISTYFDESEALKQERQRQLHSLFKIEMTEMGLTCGNLGNAFNFSDIVAAIERATIQDIEDVIKNADIIRGAWSFKQSEQARVKNNHELSLVESLNRFRERFKEYVTKFEFIFLLGDLIRLISLIEKSLVQLKSIDNQSRGPAKASLLGQAAEAKDPGGKTRSVGGEMKSQYPINSHDEAELKISLFNMQVVGLILRFMAPDEIDIIASEFVDIVFTNLRSPLQNRYRNNQYYFPEDALACTGLGFDTYIHLLEFKKSSKAGQLNTNFPILLSSLERLYQLKLAQYQKYYTMSRPEVEAHQSVLECNKHSIQVSNLLLYTQSKQYPVLKSSAPGIGKHHKLGHIDLSRFLFFPSPKFVFTSLSSISKEAGKNVMWCKWEKQYNQQPPPAVLSLLSNNRTTLHIDGIAYPRDQIYIKKVICPESYGPFNGDLEVLPNLAHPNIVACIDYLKNAENQHVITEYIDGEMVQSILHSHSNQRLSEEEILLIFTQICLAIDYLHEQNILHRNIKPSNIMLSRQGLVKLIGFSCSKKYQKNVIDEPVDDSICGTPLYLGPEIMSRQPYGAEFDIWSLGVTLFELVTGNVPFMGENLRGLAEKVTTQSHPPIDDRTKTPELLCLVDRLLCKKVKERPTVRQILAEPLLQIYVNKLIQKYNVPELLNNITDKHHQDMLIEQNARILNRSPAKMKL